MATSKRTKKFEKKNLKSTLERRKEVAKVKQRTQIREKKKAKRRADDEFYRGSDQGDKPVEKKPAIKASAMSVDDFFQGGFDIIDKPATQGKLGKRKREQAAPEKRDHGSEDESKLEFSDDNQQQPDSASDGEVDQDDHDDENNDGVGMSRGTMKSLKASDPEFFQFLQENDPQALEFDPDADFAEIDELSASEDEKGEQKDAKKTKKKKNQASEAEKEGKELTQEMVATWKRSMAKTYSLRAARQVVIAFRSAANLNDGEKQRYSIQNPATFHQILTVALKQLPEVLQHHLPVKASASGKPYINTDNKKFKTLSMMIKSFVASIIQLLSTLSDEATVRVTISALEPLLPYLMSFRKLLKLVVKTVVAFWAQPASTETTRVQAYLIIRKVMVIGDAGIREIVLKATYQGLVQGSRHTNANTMQGISLMKNSAAELWGLDQNLGYTTAFTCIRQLAIHLRNSLVNNSRRDEAFRTVYNWQYVHSLDFWSTVLSQHCNALAEAEAGRDSPLKPLIYPLVQVTLGTMRLIPSSTYFPLRFHLVRSLLRLSRATDTYIPLASTLLEVINSAEMKKPAHSSTLKQLDFSVAYKAPKTYLRTRVYQDGVGEQVVELFSEFFFLWCKSIAFPELALPVIILLKRWLKESRTKSKGNKNGRLGSSLVLLVQKLEANATFIEEKRAKVEFAPKNRAQVEAFLRELDGEKTPVGAFVVGQRRARAERQKVMQEAKKEEEKRRRAVRGEETAGEPSSEPDSEGGDDDAVMDS